jgi:hypothetical protein
VETKIQTGLQKIEVEITKKIKATPVFSGKHYNQESISIL